MVCGLPFISTLYSVGPILVVPAGRIKFCAATALTISAGAKPYACNLAVSRSTCTWRGFPPKG